MRTTTTHRVLAVLNLPRHVPDQIKLGQTLQAALASNPHFPLPDPIIAAFIAALGPYDAAETAAQTRAKGPSPPATRRRSSTSGRFTR